MTGLEALAEAARLELGRVYSRTSPEWHYFETPQTVDEQASAVERHLRLVIEEATA